MTSLILELNQAVKEYLVHLVNDPLLSEEGFRHVLAGESKRMSERARRDFLADSSKLGIIHFLLSHQALFLKWIKQESSEAPAHCRKILIVLKLYQILNHPQLSPMDKIILFQNTLFKTHKQKKSPADFLSERRSVDRNLVYATGAFFKTVAWVLSLFISSQYPMRGKIPKLTEKII